LERLVAALPKCRNQQAADVVSLLLLSGARVGEVKAMRWDQISFERQLWVKPASATKQKRSHHVPLSPPAIEILLRIYETAKTGPDRFSPDNGCMWVFPNRASGKHRPGTAQQDVKPLGDIKNSWATICKNADVKNIRIHDLRHAYGTYLASSGLSLPIIGRLLGHSQAATTDRYVHAQMDPLRLAADRVAARVEAAKGAATAEIVKLPRPA
jgi:integrase